jgi:hypothetical protein
MLIYNEEMEVFRFVLVHDAKFYLFEGIKIYKFWGNTEENDTKKTKKIKLKLFWRRTAVGFYSCIYFLVGQILTSWKNVSQ